MTNEPKKLKDLLPDSFKPENEIDTVAIIQKDKLTREQKSIELIKVFNSLKPNEKFKAINNQIKGLSKTYDIVLLPGRVMAKDEPQILYMMTEELFHYAGMNDAGLARTVTDVLIETYGWMALQDFALFFRKIKAGLYGEVYGKMNGMWIAGKIKNFQQSVQYNLAVDREAVHYERKRLDGCRDLGTYYDDVMPEILE